jgi:hypothetical protein
LGRDGDFPCLVGSFDLHAKSVPFAFVLGFLGPIRILARPTADYATDKYNYERVAHIAALLVHTAAVLSKVHKKGPEGNFLQQSIHLCSFSSHLGYGRQFTGCSISPRWSLPIHGARLEHKRIVESMYRIVDYSINRGRLGDSFSRSDTQYKRGRECFKVSQWE